MTPPRLYTTKHKWDTIIGDLGLIIPPVQPTLLPNIRSPTWLRMTIKPLMIKVHDYTQFHMKHFIVIPPAKLQGYCHSPIKLALVIHLWCFYIIHCNLPSNLTLPNSLLNPNVKGLKSYWAWVMSVPRRTSPLRMVYGGVGSIYKIAFNR